MNSNNYKKYNLRYNNLNKIKNKLIANLFRNHTGGANTYHNILNEKLNELDKFRTKTEAIKNIIREIFNITDSAKRDSIINNHTKLLNSFNDFIKHNNLEKSKLSELLLLIDIQMIKLQLKPAIKNTSSNKSFDDEYVRKLMETLIKLSDSINNIQISS
jgi:hypothetical protein